MRQRKQQDLFTDAYTADLGYRRLALASLMVLTVVPGAGAVLVQSQSWPDMPAGMRECEGRVCGTWVFNCRSGTARWANGATATLTVKRFDGDTVVLSRTDMPGTTSAGLAARYEGVCRDNEIWGTVTFS
jgi:hypothetical protein